MTKKALAAAVLAGIMALALTGCGGDKKAEKKAPAGNGKKVVLRVAYETARPSQSASLGRKPRKSSTKNPEERWKSLHILTPSSARNQL